GRPSSAAVAVFIVTTDTIADKPTPCLLSNLQRLVRVPVAHYVSASRGGDFLAQNCPQTGTTSVAVKLEHPRAGTRFVVILGQVEFHRPIVAERGRRGQYDGLQPSGGKTTSAFGLGENPDCGHGRCFKDAESRPPICLREAPHHRAPECRPSHLEYRPRSGLFLRSQKRCPRPEANRRSRCSPSAALSLH